MTDTQYTIAINRMTRRAESAERRAERLERELAATREVAAELYRLCRGAWVITEARNDR